VVTVERTRMTPLWGVLVIAVAAALGACGDDPSVTLVEGVTEPVDAIDNSFRPGEVKVAAGTEVVWTNAGRHAHNVLPVEGDEWGAEAEAFGPGDTYQHRFTEPGTYAYYCSLHGTTTKGMVGTLVVTG
jgi:plastocyanin